MILHTKVMGKGEAILFLHTGLQTGETDLVHDEQSEIYTKILDLFLQNNKLNRLEEIPQ